MNQLIIRTCVLIALAIAPGFSFAAQPIADTDADGLIDSVEAGQYGTNPQVFDTDDDGRGDGDEVLDGTDPLDSKSSRIEELSKPDPGLLGDATKFSWYVGRSSGIAAFIVLTFVTCFGLIISSRAFFKIVPGPVAMETHRFLAWTGLALVLLHAGSFLFDEFFHITVGEMLIPFSISRDLKSTLGFDIGKTVALGSIALYLLLILLLTSEFRSKMSFKLWRKIHYVAFLFYVLFMIHGFTSGSDSNEWWMQALYIVSLSLVIGLVIIRIIFRNILPKIRAKNTTPIA